MTVRERLTQTEQARERVAQLQARAITAVQDATRTLHGLDAQLVMLRDLVAEEPS